jgi:hypothetical protein
VKQSGYLQSVLIDARKALGGKCRRQDVLVEIAIKPKPGGAGEYMNVVLIAC